MDYPKLQPGATVTQIPRQLINDCNDMVRWWKTQYGRTGGPAGDSIAQRSTIVPVKNVSGAAVDICATLAIKKELIDPATNLIGFQLNFGFEVETPPTLSLLADPYTPMAITLEPIGVNKIGRAVIAGLAAVKVNVTSAFHRYATLTPSDRTKLTSNAHGGARIVWRQTGTGDKWAIVMLAERERLVPFELKDDIDGSGATSSTAHPLERDVSTGNWAPNLDAGLEFEVRAHSTYGTAHGFIGCGRDGTNGYAGSRGLARWFEGNLFEIVSLQPPALVIKGDYYESTGRITSPEAIMPKGGVIFGRDADGRVGVDLSLATVPNGTFIHAFLYGKPSDTNPYRLLPTTMVQQHTFVTDVQIVGGVIQKKTRTANVFLPGSESGWT